MAETLLSNKQAKSHMASLRGILLMIEAARKVNNGGGKRESFCTYFPDHLNECENSLMPRVFPDPSVTTPEISPQKLP